MGLAFHDLERRLNFERLNSGGAFKANVRFVGDVNYNAAKMRRVFQYFHLGFFVYLLDIVFSNAEESQGLFRAAPKIRGASYVVVRPKKVQSLIKSVKESSVVYFLKFDVGFFSLGKLEIGFLIVGVEEVVEDRFGDNIFQSIDYFLVIFGIESGFGPLLQGIFREFDFIFDQSGFNGLTIRHVHKSKEIMLVVV